MSKIFKKDRYYELKYPMNMYQEKAHNAAMKRTVQEVREFGWKITHKHITKVLSIVHLYIMYLAFNMHRRTEKGYFSVSKVKIGYFRTIFTKLFIDMRDSGEFTKEEFEIIRNEFYKEEFDVYYKILKQQKAWRKKWLNN